MQKHLFDKKNDPLRAQMFLKLLCFDNFSARSKTHAMLDSPYNFDEKLKNGAPPVPSAEHSTTSRKGKGYTKQMEVFKDFYVKLVE